MSGQVGEPGQYDKLTYVSLIHQIDSAIEKGFNAKEVTHGIFVMSTVTAPCTDASTFSSARCH